MFLILETSYNFAEGDEDYASGPYNVTFIAGDMIAAFDVPVNNDHVFEGNENFTLFIDRSSLFINVTVIDPMEATVTIIDDDSEYLVE